MSSSSKIIFHHAIYLKPLPPGNILISIAINNSSTYAYVKTYVFWLPNCLTNRRGLDVLSWYCGNVQVKQLLELFFSFLFLSKLTLKLFAIIDISVTFLTHCCMSTKYIPGYLPVGEDGVCSSCLAEYPGVMSASILHPCYCWTAECDPVHFHVAWHKLHLRCLKLSGTLGPKRSIKFFARQLAILSAYSQIFEDAIAWLNISANSRRSWQEAALLLRNLMFPFWKSDENQQCSVLSLHHLFSPRNSPSNFPFSANLLSSWCSSFFFLTWIGEPRIVAGGREH